MASHLLSQKGGDQNPEELGNAGPPLSVLGGGAAHGCLQEVWCVCVWSFVVTGAETGHILRRHFTEFLHFVHH